MKNRFAINPPEIVELPIVGSDLQFPVRRIYCAGRNYADHAAELGNAKPGEPFYFIKHRDEIVPSGSTLLYPPQTRDFQYEVELVVALRSGGRDISVDRAHDHVFGYAVGLDMTRRDLQHLFKERRLPWSMAKSFDQSAPCGPITTASQVGQLAKGRIRLWVNDQLRQDGDLSTMIWSVAELISDLSRKVRLAEGDLLFTGTPAGVGPVVVGDKMRGEIDGLQPLVVTVGQAHQPSS
jgi:fumarylpyruvate hydrolase